MKIEIKQEKGHYVAFVDGVFFGSYDTFSEAVKDIDSLKSEKEAA